MQAIMKIAPGPGNVVVRDIVPAANIHLLPDNVDFRAGALTEPLACVVHATLTTPTVTPGDVAVIAGPPAPSACSRCRW
jgi:threonine dehydrogenase-like Zn-dependent dehydrogenase